MCLIIFLNHSDECLSFSVNETSTRLLKVLSLALCSETVHYQSCSRAILSSSGASAKETDRCLYLCHEHAPVRDFSFTDPVRTFTSTRPEICSVHSRLKSLGGFEMNVRSTFSTAYVRFAESSDLSKHKVKGQVIFYLFVTLDLVTWPVGASKG